MALTGPTTYQRPETIADAAALLATDGARVLAGGTDLVPQVRERRRTVRTLVDVKHIAELRSLARAPEGGWRIGAAVPVTALGRDPAFAREHAPLLASARLIGSLQVQSRATLAGNLVNAAPSADAVPLLIALGATAEIASAAGRRVTPAGDIPIAPGRTSLAAGELVTALLLPPLRPHSAACYLRFTPRREMDIAIAGSGVSLTLGDGDIVADAQVVLASVAPRPLVSDSAAGALRGARLTAASIAATAAAAARDATPISDTRGSADYRRKLVAVLTRRALEACAADLGIALT